MPLIISVYDTSENLICTGQLHNILVHGSGDIDYQLTKVHQPCCNCEKPRSSGDDGYVDHESPVP
jgi:hypothetical protein